MYSEILLFRHLQTSSKYINFKQAASRLNFESGAQAQKRKAISLAGRSLARRCHFLVSLAASPRSMLRSQLTTPRVLLLQREPARRLILEMSSALPVWDVTKTIPVEQITSLTQCLFYYFRKQSVQDRGEKFNHKRYRIILEIKECRWRAIFPVITIV